MIFPDWQVPARVAALCTTREDDERDIPAALGAPVLELPHITQVHGARVLRAESPGDNREADAVVSETPGLGCRIVTADCLPILLASRRGDEVAAAHAGWRGLSAGVIEATTGAMRTAPEELVAWIGPAISRTHYEVGADVLEAFVNRAHDGEVLACFEPRGDKFMADLPRLARLRLHRLGVGQVFGGDFCTYADPRFHSWRRDGEAAGRLCSVICLLR